MQVLFDGEVPVEYSQVYVVSGRCESGDPMGDAFAGQVNGLCGGASPGFLFLRTGLTVGRIPFTFELHESEPPMDERWEDAVEVSFRPGVEPVTLIEWGGLPVTTLPLDPVDFPVRYAPWGWIWAREWTASLRGNAARIAT